MSKLDAAVAAYRAIGGCQIENRTASGAISGADFYTLASNLEREGLLLESDPQTNLVRFRLPAGVEHFAVSMSDLIEAPSRQIHAPSRFYVADIDYMYIGNCAGAPAVIINYVAAATLAKMLLEISDHQDRKGAWKAIFLHGEKLELHLGYELVDLKPMPQIEDFICQFANSDIHQEQMATIIKTVLLEMMRSGSIGRFSLPDLIRRFDEFVERVKGNYQLYVSEFSFEKIKAQVEKEVFEFTLRLNKAFSEIQNQLLAIPVAVILVGSQMELQSVLSLKNFSIWIGSCVFALLISLLIRNQRSTLKAIKLEIDSQWRVIKAKHLFVEEKMGRLYTNLTLRYWNQVGLLWLIDLIVSFGVVGSTAMLLLSSGEWSRVMDVLRAGIMPATIYIGLCLATPIFFLCHRWIK